MSKADSRVSEKDNPPPHIQPELIKPPKCFLDTESGLVEWILKPLSQRDKDSFLTSQKAVKEWAGGTYTVQKSLHSSFDTSILDLADDIAYGVHDLEDAVSLGLISRDQWHNYLDQSKLNTGSLGERTGTPLVEKLFAGSSSERKDAIGSLVNHFITNVRVKVDETFESPLLKYRAELHPDARSLLTDLQAVVYECVINSAEVKTLEHGGWHVIKRLFEALQKRPEHYLPEDFRERLDASDEEQRVICDYIAGMTDNYANRIYERLYVPGSGTVFEKL